MFVIPWAARWTPILPGFGMSLPVLSWFVLPSDCSIGAADRGDIGFHSCDCAVTQHAYV